MTFVFTMYKCTIIVMYANSAAFSIDNMKWVILDSIVSCFDDVLNAYYIMYSGFSNF